MFSQLHSRLKHKGKCLGFKIRFRESKEVFENYAATPVGKGFFQIYAIVLNFEKHHFVGIERFLNGLKASLHAGEVYSWQ